MADSTNVDQSQTGDGDQDYKALLEAERDKTATLEKERDKLGADFSSLKGSVKSQTSRDAERQDDIQALTKSVSAIAKAMESGESEGLTESVGKFSEEAAQTATHDRFVVRAESIFVSLEEALLGEDGKPVLDMKTAPQLEKMRELWTTGANNDTLAYGDRLDFLQQSVGETYKQVRIAERVQKKEVSEKETETRAKSLDNDSGGGGASAGRESVDTLLKKDLRSMTPAENVKFLADLDAASRRESR